jgi:hypothetical protein
MTGGRRRRHESAAAEKRKRPRNEAKKPCRQTGGRRHTPTARLNAHGPPADGPTDSYRAPVEVRCSALSGTENRERSILTVLEERADVHLVHRQRVRDLTAHVTQPLTA